MPGDDLYIFRHHRQHLLHARYHPADTPSALHIHERKAVSHKIVAHMDHVGLREKDDAVAVSVAIWKMNRPDVLAVQMDSGPIVKGYYRQRFLRCRWHSTA